MLKLYYSPGACSMAPHIALEEIGRPYQTELVSSAGGRMTNTPEWRAVNPKGRVPALLGVPGRIGGADGLLTEASAILVYLARTNPDARLLPADPAAEARCLEWLSWLGSAVHAVTYGLIWRPRRYSDDAADDAALLAKGQATVREQYAYIESLLADGRDWAVPGGYSVADPYLLVFYRWGQVTGLDMSSYPAWTALTRATVARPAVGRVLAKEAITIP